MQWLRHSWPTFQVVPKSALDPDSVLCAVLVFAVPHDDVAVRHPVPKLALDTRDQFLKMVLTFEGKL